MHVPVYREQANWKFSATSCRCRITSVFPSGEHQVNRRNTRGSQLLRYVPSSPRQRQVGKLVGLIGLVGQVGRQLRQVRQQVLDLMKSSRPSQPAGHQKKKERAQDPIRERKGKREGAPQSIEWLTTSQVPPTNLPTYLYQLIPIMYVSLDYKLLRLPTAYL